MDTKIFLQRRQIFFSRLKKSSVAILAAAPEKFRNGTTEYRYRPDSSFYYLTGFSEPESYAVLCDNEFILFNRESNPDEEQWSGKRLGQEAAKELLGAQQAFPVNELEKKLLTIFQNKQHIYFDLNNKHLYQIVIRVIEGLKPQSRRGIPCPENLHDIKPLLAQMRLIKDAAEIQWLQQAAEISAYAHRVMMENCRPGMKEYELEAILAYELKRKGCLEYAYPPIIAAGRNSCILHYCENKNEIGENDLVLIDAGGEYEFYAADITRTFPASGRFSAEQKAIYEIVLQAQKEVIAAIRPGVRYGELQQLSEKIITEGLIAVGILQGDLNDNLAERKCQPFYMHSVSHWLGMDVHDPGYYRENGESILLKENMVLTVEPGIYILPRPDVAKKWWNIGVRVEDDIWVTPTSNEVLSAAAPKEITDIER